ncbi:class I SAM-dependent methyltransferase [Turicibacter sp. KK003]|uniref:class I SAM-dependent methyltransferase n=1 Tax=Turicibacter sp. KK003 TaxID=3114695 RepID=UPI0030CFA639
MNFNQVEEKTETDICKKRVHAISQEIESYIGHGPLEVMEFGCQTGLISLNLQHKIASGLMVDSSKQDIEVFENTLKAHHISHIKTFTGDILTSNFDQTFDVIYAAMVMSPIKDVQPIINKLASYLKKHGKLIIVDLLRDNGAFYSEEPNFEGHHGFKINEMVTHLTDAGLKDVLGRKFYSGYKPLKHKNHPYSLFSIVGVK